jgi:hypothetical protein
MSRRPFSTGLLALAALASSAHAAVEIAPRNPVLQAGQSLSFRAWELGASRSGCRWSVRGAGGAIDPAGLFTGAPGRYWVRATSLADASDWAETAALILPEAPALQVVQAVLGPGSFAPGWSDALPFHDIVHRNRFGDPQAVVNPIEGAGYAVRQVLGYGLKVPVDWPRWGLRPEALLLSYLESGEPVRIDATGQPHGELQLRGSVAHAQIEALNPSGRSAWMSRTQKLRIKVRGLVPCAGNPVAGAGDADGSWLGARFRRPVGLTVLGNDTLVAADPEAHVLRAISAEREVLTLWGSAGHPGHQDGRQEQARFRGPTFVAARPSPAQDDPWPAALSFVVSDSGNHVIRAVDALGKVTTLAGGPGQRGHRDGADPHLARFDDPQGLAVDSAGTIYVADRGNHVIRAISHLGAVTTLAGSPGQPGSQDGTGSEARFRDLKGLAIGRSTEAMPGHSLYVVDGHSLRRVGLGGEVATLCGDPATPGTPALAGGPPAHLAGVPCLDNPHGIAVAWPRIILTDRGNHAIQVLRPDYGGRIELSTLVGDRALTATRFGLLRSGLQGPPGPEFAALGDPMGVAVDAWGDFYITDGPCVVHCSEPGPFENLTPPALVLVPGGKVAAGLALAVDFAGPRRPWPEDAGPEDEPVPFFWTLDFVQLRTGEPAAARANGQIRGRSTGSAPVTFEEKGEVEVRLVCITTDGVAMEDRVRIMVD